MAEQVDFLLPELSGAIEDDLFADDFMKFLADADFVAAPTPAEPATSVGSDCCGLVERQQSPADVSSGSDFTATPVLASVDMVCGLQIPIITTAGINDQCGLAATGPRTRGRTEPCSPSGTNYTSSSDAEAVGASSGLPFRQPSSQPSTSDSEPQLTKKQIAANKRKAPEVDWRAIDDPAERRRQRRLAKNRVTAARSRERKKEQWGEMEAQLTELQEENQQMNVMMEAMMRENASLKEQLASLTRGASAACFTGTGPEPAVLRCLAIMHLVCRYPCVRLSVIQVDLLLYGLLSWQQLVSRASFYSLHSSFGRFCTAGKLVTRTLASDHCNLHGGSCFWIAGKTVAGTLASEYRILHVCSGADVKGRSPLTLTFKLSPKHELSPKPELFSRGCTLATVRWAAVAELPQVDRGREFTSRLV